MTWEEFKKEIENLDENELKALRSMIDNNVIDKKDEELKEKIKSNSIYVGKCYKVKVKPNSGLFPEMYKYLKVISERSTNDCRMEVLTFEEHPVYWFEYQDNKGYSVGNYFCGSFDYVGIHTEDYPFFCYKLGKNLERQKKEIDYLEEISLEEYNTAMNQYIKELQELTWYPDHYRFGDKLPSSEDWPRKE